MHHSPLFILLIVGSLPLSCSPNQSAPSPPTAPAIENPTNRVLLSSEVQWEALNPARGDKSPKAGTLWGDRKGTVATGFLAKFVDGFSSPPHIHNVTYRAMVLKGLVHNDDPEAEKMWMPPGSFWTQPAGEVHITAAQGEENIAYVEIDRGPYLVKPTEEAFDNGERPVNVDVRNIVWLDASKTTLVDAPQAAISFLWKNGNTSGYLVKLSPRFTGNIHSTGTPFHGVVITGEVGYRLPMAKADSILDPGSYFTSTGPSVHTLQNAGTEESLIYLRTNGQVQIGSETASSSK